MIKIEFLKNSLDKLFDKLESEEVLLIIKECFIDSLVYNLEFDENYSERKKSEYFKKLEYYLKIMNHNLCKQKIISNFKLNELYKIYDFEDFEYVLRVLNDSVEYIKSNYIYIDILRESIQNKDIPNYILNDLNKINEFLELHNYKASEHF